MGFLFVLAILLAVAAFWLHRSADKSEERFANRLAVISEPAKDLFANQKYAIIKFLAYTQGASPLSAYDDEATRIIQDTARSLGLSQSEVIKCIKVSMSHDSEREMSRMLESLDEIRDRGFLKEICRKAMRIAHISGDTDAVGMVEAVMRELRL